MSSTDVLSAMLSSDLSGSHDGVGRLRGGSRAHDARAAGSGELARMSNEPADAPAIATDRD
ncbi:MAG TPA: hypothetical protein VN253_16840 [Kofleriaceae bacterium]|nr:hypothetical protein [Kofleriaceae bacterium]